MRVNFAAVAIGALAGVLINTSVTAALGVVLAVAVLAIVAGAADYIREHQ